VRTAAATLAAVTTLMAAPAAHAGWKPARVTRDDIRPLAAAAPGNVFSIWGGGTPTRRLTFPAPQSMTVPFASDIRSGPWLANRRGDVLMVDRVGRDGALLVEAGGTRARMSMELSRGTYPFRVAGALAEDGSADRTARRAAGPSPTGARSRSTNCTIRSSSRASVPTACSDRRPWRPSRDRSASTWPAAG
jgi:hypothetical protein